MRSEVNVSIEFSHVYTDQEPEKICDLSLERFKQHATRLKSEGKTFSAVVLIDDLHVREHRLGREAICRQIRAKAGDVDHFIFESELLKSFQILLRAIPKNSLYYQPFREASRKVLFLKTEQGPVALGNFAQRKFMPTCALLAACWHLIRLGATPAFNIPPARLSLSILDEQYRMVEDKAKRIIEASSFSHFASRIMHDFYKAD